MIKYLEKEIIGGGEVKDFIFTRISYTDTSYLYKVDDSDSSTHYEVFRRKNTPICIDFEKRIYSDVDSKETYPKSKDFGIWAWAYRDLNEAMRRFLDE